MLLSTILRYAKRVSKVKLVDHLSKVSSYMISYSSWFRDGSTKMEQIHWNGAKLSSFLGTNRVAELRTTWLIGFIFETWSRLKMDYIPLVGLVVDYMLLDSFPTFLLIIFYAKLY